MSAAAHFTDESMLRRVHREAAVALSGPRALLMMAAHPVAFEGFFASTGDLGDPYARLRRTADVLDAIAWGPSDRADAMTRRVRAVHRRARGELPVAAGPYPAGTPYRADDPALLLWIVACLADSALLVYERFVVSLIPRERDAYWADQRLVGRLFGLRDADMPASWIELRAYVDELVGGPTILVTPRARELGRRIVLEPPVPLVARPLLELANAVTVGLLPPRVREGYGLSWDPVRELMLVGAAEYTKRVLMPILPDRVRVLRTAQM